MRDVGNIMTFPCSLDIKIMVDVPVRGYMGSCFKLHSNRNTPTSEIR